MQSARCYIYSYRLYVNKFYFIFEKTTVCHFIKNIFFNIIKCNHKNFCKIWISPDVQDIQKRKNRMNRTYLKTIKYLYSHCCFNMKVFKK